MAKDGTVRGGARAGAGRKSKDLADKIIEGKAELDNGAVILSEPTRCRYATDKRLPESKTKEW